MKRLLLILFCFPMLALAQSGCTNSAACNYDSLATIDDGSCFFSGNQDPAQAQDVFNANNIETTLGTSAFMWDLSSAKYEIPKGSGKHSLFAHEYWMGGVDDGGVLRFAAQTYKQGGSDFFAGPHYNICDNNTDSLQSLWDRVWKVNKTEIINHAQNYNDPLYVMPEVIENWPAHGDTSIGHEFYLAPFIDFNNDGIYNPLLGDHPDIQGNLSTIPDQAIYIIRNDIGNIHTETDGDNIGVEQHIMFYGYQSACIYDNTLFVKMKIFNRSSRTINQFYTGNWVDPDLGYYNDDYVGYNAQLKMAYCYNGDAEDEGATGYGFVPPAIGFLSLQGPLADINDGIDNDFDGITDEAGEVMHPSKFMYYNNDFTVTGNPEDAADHYNYLRGIWKDNTPLTYGGDGHGAGTGSTNQMCDYMFPGNTDWTFPGQDWSEITTGNAPGDRRFLVSYGPFTFESGGMREIDYAIVWSRASSGGPTASASLLNYHAMEVIGGWTQSYFSDTSCLSLLIPGCMDSLALNYSPYSTVDDSSCCYILGCMDIMAYNYNINACIDDASCNYYGVEITRLEGRGNGGVNLELTDQSISDILNDTAYRTFHPTYKNGCGPVNITIVDSVNFTPGEYIIKLDSVSFYNAYTPPSYGSWSILDSSGNLVDSSSVGNSKFVSQLGIKVSVEQQVYPGEDPMNIDANGIITSSMEFDNPNDKWLTGLADRDDQDGTYWGLNWIRAGSYTDDNYTLLSDYNQNDDPNGTFENLVSEIIMDSLLFGGSPFQGGTWSPYAFASYFHDGPGFYNSITNQAHLANLHSVDIVFTSDTSKWSKVCVVEAQDNPSLAVGNQVKMGLRQSPSLDINGNPANDGTMGMSYFPGYAIDLETGERLNIIFSEDSWQDSENGNDMLWNPTSNIVTDSLPIYNYNNNEFDTTGGHYKLGGKHFIYIVRGEAWVKGTDDYINDIANCDNSPNYDECAWVYEELTNTTPLIVGQWYVFKNVSWVGAPLLVKGKSIPDDSNPNDVRVKLRVTKPYSPYVTVDGSKILDQNMPLTIGEDYVVAYSNVSPANPGGIWGGYAVTHDGNTYNPGEDFIATTTTFTGSNKARAIEAIALNAFNPIYSFKLDPITQGCTDSLAINYNPLANTDDSSCVYCMMSNTLISIPPSNVNSCDGMALVNNNSNYPITSYLWEDTSGVIIGTTSFTTTLCNTIYFITVVDSLGCSDRDTLILGLILGCSDSTALNYNPWVNQDDSSCVYPIYGCMDSTMFNYNPFATVDNGSCIPFIFGCSDSIAYNYNPLVNTDDGSCQYCNLSYSLFVSQNSSASACNGWAVVTNLQTTNLPVSYLWSTGSSNDNIISLCSGIYTVTVTDNVGCSVNTSFVIGTLTYGCTDSAASNYDPLANVDDGSCTYPATCAEDAPTGLHTTDVLQNRATINWDNMNSSVCMVDQYRINYSADGGATWTQKTMGQPVGSCLWATQNTDKLILNLIPSTTYLYKMKAWYCGGGNSAWTAVETFTTLDDCPNVGNLAVTTPSTTKATFTWDDSNGAYSFTRIKSRVDTNNGVWFNVGGSGVSYGIFTKDKNNLTPGASYRGQARTWCDPNGGAYKSPTWTSLVYWTMPTVIRLEGGNTIANLEVYPNPSRDIFNVTFTSKTIQDLKVRILNLIGEELINEELQQFVGEYTKKIDLTDNAKGIYFLEIETEDGIINKKLILQ